MARGNILVATAIALGMSTLAAAELKSCGKAQYDPEQYVCYDNNFLCPVIAGEPLSYCSGACYSKFQYKCNNNVLAVLPTLGNIPFTLTASNPKVPAIDGKPVTACGQHWTVAGQTCSYCPAQVGSSCPAGNVTGVVAGSGAAGMDVLVPGGQQVYLDPFWNVGYTQAHSAYVPSGSIRDGFAAYKGGGFVNLNGNGYGWVACPPTASGGGGTSGWNLVAKNSTNSANLNSCYGVNLRINELPPNTIVAWQYT